MKKTGCLVLLIGLLAGAGYLSLTYVVPRYDQLKTEREAVRREWAQVDTLLQRRYELIPNLMETVKGYVDHEAKVLTEIADAHNGYLKARSQDARMQAAYRAEKAIRSCARFAIMRYPNLKADRLFVKLMGSLETSEDLIAKQRMSYNTVVATLNADVQSALGALVAKLAGVEEASYYNPPTETEALPKVDFVHRTPEQAEAAAEQAAKAKAPKLEDLQVTGFVEGAGGPEAAFVQFPDGTQRSVKAGQEILELRARVKLIDAKGVVFEEHSLDDQGKPVSRLVRVDK